MVVLMEVDAQLLDSARRFDKDALIRIFDLYSSPLYHFALRLSGDPVLADHVVGDVFGKLLDQFSLGKGPTRNLRSYLYECTYHQIIDEKKLSRCRAPMEVVEWLWQDPNTSYASLENRLLFQQVGQAMRTCLTADQRHVVILRFLQGCSLRETASITGKSVGNVKVIQGRAILALRKTLEHVRTRLGF